MKIPHTMFFLPLCHGAPLLSKKLLEKHQQMLDEGCCFAFFFKKIKQTLCEVLTVFILCRNHRLYNKKWTQLLCLMTEDNVDVP